MNGQDQTPFPLALPLLLIHIKGTHTEEHPYSRSEMCVFVSQRHFEDDMLLSVLGFISSKCLLFADPAHRYKCCVAPRRSVESKNPALQFACYLFCGDDHNVRMPPGLALKLLLPCLYLFCFCRPCCYGIGHSLQCYMEGRWSCVLEELWRGRLWREVRSEDGGVWGKCEGV